MMSTKLFKFVKEAADYANSCPAGQLEIRIWKNMFHSKYAELIIKECSRVMIEEDEYYGEWMSKVIEKGFEVKL